MSILVLTITAIVAFILFRTDRAIATFVDALSSAVFAANWRFIATGTDYFHAGNAVSPLQHFWSLGVEEQFYLFWPWLLLVVLFVSTHFTPTSKAASRVILGCVITLLTGASFAWSLSQSDTSTTWAYFSTLSRGWELGVGGILAVLTPLFVRIDERWRPLLAWMGLAGIVCSVMFVGENGGFPAPWATLPVLSTALVILAGTGGHHRQLWPLTNSIARYVGDISFSLYLWHFPVIVFVESFYTTQGTFEEALAFAITVLCSVVSYHAIEKPFHKSPQRVSGRRIAKVRPSSQKTFLWLALRWTTFCAIAVVGVLMTVTCVRSQLLPTIESAAPQSTPDTTRTRPLEVLQRQLAAALEERKWPTLDPTVDELLTKGKPLEEADGCGTTDVADPGLCAFGDVALPEIVVYGDSTGLTLLPTVRAAFGDQFRIRALSMPGCPVIELNMRFVDPNRERDCLAFRKASLEEIQRTRPQLVLLTNTYTAALELSSRAGSEGAATEWSQAVRKTVSKIRSGGTAVVAVSPPPLGKSLGDCATPVSTPASCVSEVPRLWFTISHAEQTAIGENYYVDTHSWFCASSTACPAFIGSTPLKRDAVHTTRQFAVELAPLFRTTLLSKRVL